MTQPAMARGVRARRWRSTVDPSVMITDYRCGYIEAVSIRLGCPPAFIAAADQATDGTWTVRTSPAVDHGICTTGHPDCATAVTHLEEISAQYADRVIEIEVQLRDMETKIQRWAEQNPAPPTQGDSPWEFEVRLDGLVE